MNRKVINIRRTKQYGETTLGSLSIQGVAKSWYVLEPGGPDSETEGSDKRIKAGSYRVKPYSSFKYKDVYKLEDVPGRTYILIHSGNYHEDTQGCLMPGKSWGVKSDKHYYVGHSRQALREIFAEIKSPDEIVINITNVFGD